MKIRTDFVTNSSSASFILYTVKDKHLSKFLLEITGTDNRSLDIDAPMGAGGCGTGFSLYDDELEIQDYENPNWYSDVNKNYMKNLFDAIVFYLNQKGCTSINEQYTLDRLEFLVEEAKDNKNYSRKRFMSTSD